jgi:biopolymer transport protein ExbD
MASNIIKRRRARKRGEQDEDPEFQVAPMVDVLLVLLLFFMSITSTELLKKERNLHLADANNAKKDDHKKEDHKVTINVTWDGINSVAGFTMDGATYPDANSFVGILAARIKADPQTIVLIRADKDAQYSNISDLMHACAQGGIGTVTFAVIQGDAQKPPADAAPAPSNP